MSRHTTTTTREKRQSVDQIIQKGKGKDSGLKRKVDRREEKTGWKSEKIQFGRQKRNDESGEQSFMTFSGSHDGGQQPLKRASQGCLRLSKRPADKVEGEVGMVEWEGVEKRCFGAILVDLGCGNCDGSFDSAGRGFFILLSVCVLCQRDGR